MRKENIVIKKFFVVSFLTAAIAVAAYFGYAKYSDYKLIQALMPHVKNTSLRIANALSYETENTNITYKEFFEKIENDIAEIEKRILEVQTIASPSNKATTDVVIDYIKTGQALLRSQLGLNRKRFAVSVSDEAKSLNKATSETEEARTAFLVSLKKMVETRVQLSALMPADSVLDTILLKKAIDKINEEIKTFSSSTSDTEKYGCNGNFLNFEPIVTKLDKSFLKIKISIEFESNVDYGCDDPLFHKLKNMFIMALSSRSSDELSTSNGKINIKNEMIERINRIFKPNSVKEIYFSEFIMQ